MEYKYWLPDENAQFREIKTKQNVVIIVGANGSGKSKLGAWMEYKNPGEIHRVGAQRKLNFTENIPLKNFTEAENVVLYGYVEGNANDKMINKWGNNQSTIKMVEDYDYVLSALLAHKNNEINEFVNSCKKLGFDKNTWPNVPETVIDKLRSIFREVLPQRELIEDDSKFYAVLHKNDQDIKYSATQMSDGERAVLYLAAQVLCVPENKIIIIDEPEIHLHRSIMNRLWKTLESYRQDCLFIYITHDLQFASSHGRVDKIWIKDYDGTHWHFEKLSEEDLPEELTLEILGSRKSVLFVEGEKSSYDYQLYTQLYPDYLVLPCGGCGQVVSRTRAFRMCASLHDCQVYGLIDRDYRSELEIKALKDDNIYAIDVAEVENLFLVEEVIRLMATQFGVTDVDNTVTIVKEFVIDTKFKNMINRQICQSVVAEIKHQLSCIEISKINDDEAKDSLQSGLDGIKYEEIKNVKELEFKNALDSRNYRNVLRIFNEKGIAASIGRLLGIDNREYQEKVINLLNGECHDRLVGAIEGYLPREIPR